MYFFDPSVVFKLAIQMISFIILRSKFEELILFEDIFSRILYIIFSKKTSLFWSIDLRRMRDSRDRLQRNPFWGPSKPLRSFLAMPDIYVHLGFIFFQN